MELQAGVKLGQRGQLLLTPRMQQALQVLQAPAEELAVLLREALVGNPFLEEDEPGDEEEAGEVLQAELEEVPGDGGAEDETADIAAGEGRAAVLGEAVASARRGWEDRDWIDRIPGAVEPWRQKLLGQCRLLGFGLDEVRIAEQILGCLDERGYLGVRVTDIACGLSCPVERVERVRGMVLRLDPPGFAATNLAECLSVQLEQRGEGDSLAARIVERDLEPLARRRFQQIATRHRVSVERVRGAARRIRALWPHPANLVPGDRAQPIYPDLAVEEIDGRLEVLLNDRFLPRLRMVLPDPEVLQHRDPRTRAFVTRRVAQARWLVGSVEARHRTLVRLMRQIVVEQQPFFHDGAVALRPLGYRRVAGALGLHESTIARAVRGKYVQTPRGVFALRFFFSGGLEGERGEAWTAAAVMARIQDMVASESRSAPLSDEELTRRLRRAGARVARRTVAKYRDRMRIPRACYRRRV